MCSTSRGAEPRRGPQSRGGYTGLTSLLPGLSVLALWGLMNYFLESGLHAINPAAVPSALRAAEHRAAGAVCVVVSDT